MNRIDRLTAILIHLQSKQIVKAEEIADRFDISKRTVYRDIRALEEAGVPIGAEAGVGYYITDGYYLPPVMFSKNEAIAMLMAGKLTEKLTDSATNQDYQSALFKIKSVLSTSDKEFISELNEHIDIKYSTSPNLSSEQSNYLSIIQSALVNQNIISLDYKSYYKNEVTKNRLVEPIGLCYYGFSWHLIAYCNMRNDYRDFRLDRMQNIQITSEKFERKNRENMDHYFKNLMSANDLIEMVVRFDKSIYSELQSLKYYFGFIGENENDEYVEMTFLNDSITYVGGWLLKYGNKIDIVKPASLLKQMKLYTDELYKKYITL
ncbi:helix-turn-helix transcriptional regulator [Bacteroidota bacterium]